MKHKFFSFLIVAFLVNPSATLARTYDTYRPDYFKGAFCAAIGGSCAAEQDIVAGLFQNPASLTSGREDWDFDGDFTKKSNIEPGMNVNSDVSETTGVGGVGYSWEKFGAGLGFIFKRNYVDSDLTIFDDTQTSQTSKTNTKATSIQVRVPFSYMVTPTTSVGLAISVLNHRQELSVASSPAGISPAEATTVGFSVGTLFEISPNLNFGSWIRFPRTLSERLQFRSTVSGTSINYEEDLDLHFPWIWANGIKWKVARNWTLFLEGDLIGASDQGFLLSYSSLSASLGNRGLAEKGRSITFEPHLGTRISLGESEKIKLHLGTYFEPSRVNGFSGRSHYSGGLSYIVGHDFCEILAGIDLAKNHSQFIFTIR